MSTGEEEQGALVPAQSSTLKRVGTKALAVRSRDDLRRLEEAQKLLSRGEELEDEGRYDEAFQCFVEGHHLDPNDPELMFHLAYALQHAYGASPELDEEWRPYLERSLALYQRAAGLGHLESIIQLGDQYYGRAITCLGVNHEQAAKWYRMAAEKGHAGAQWRLADCYAYGIGVNQDDNEAIAWSLKALRTGNENGRMLYELLMSKPFPDRPFNSSGNYPAGYAAKYAFEIAL
jgi:TPR repeat protein